MTDKNLTEIEALQNACNCSLFGKLIVHLKQFEDRRKTSKMYFLTLNGCTISPVLNYENMNHFILGFNKSSALMIK